ncbi:MAG: 2-dehydropantoate 2-reductase [Alphaproteobacteria bacterium]|nr:2-dehydropantoate 2-reductase [Alphaproteobacteria bacterium]
MKIVVFGAGGVGGYFGARLAAGGQDVTFIARGAHLKAMNENGLKLESPLGDLHLAQVSATDNVADALKNGADVVMVCVKLWDMEAAGESLAPVLPPDTIVIPFENGVDGPEQLAAILGEDRVMGGTAHISARIAEPGVISHNGKLDKIFFGEIGAGDMSGGKSARGKAFAATCEAAGVAARLSGNIERVMWEKFIFLVAFSGMTALRRQPIGPLRDNPQDWDMFLAAMGEAAALATARGVTFREDPVAAWLPRMEAMPDSYQASMLEDLEHGRRLELNWLSGAVVRLGAEMGVDTPANSAIVEALSPFADGT